MAKFRNKNLADKLATMKPKSNLVAAKAIPKPDTSNIQGYKAYGLDKWLRLLSLLNVSKLENQYYRSENEVIREVRGLVAECAKENTYLTAQCIVYSRCVGEGMRSVNHLAATELSRYIGGQEWAKRFYGLWNKKNQKGGTVFRADDIAEMVACYSAFNPKTVRVETRNGMTSVVKNVAITNAMKKGFKSALESLDAYTLLKYKSALLDIINIVRPNPKLSKATVEYNGKRVSVLEAIIKGYNVSADTHEVAQSDAGQEVAKAVRAGKVTKAEAEIILTEAKAENWKSLLADGKLPILAALRNIRNILLNNPTQEAINMLSMLLGQKDKILQGKIMPYQIDIAHEVVTSEFNSSEARQIATTLHNVYEASLPNLKMLLPGRTLVILDMSGSMTSYKIQDASTKGKAYKSTCASKAALIAATIAKGTNADIIRFGSNAENVSYNPNQDVFTLAKSLLKDMGSTSLSSAWRLAASNKKNYERVFILSDNECNRGNSYASYKSYVEMVGDPYVYSVDMAAYGTTAIAGPKVRYYYGYGFAMFEDIAKLEFNPTAHLDKVKKIVI